jgi:hypothetical protein
LQPLRPVQNFDTLGVQNRGHLHQLRQCLGPFKTKSYGLLQVKRTSGCNGVRHPSLFCIPVHLWVSPILHDELGLVKDWLTPMEKLCDTCVKTLPNEGVENCKHLFILEDMLEDLLVEQDELSPKETIKESENHLKAIKKEIRSCNIGIPHKLTGVLITVPGLVSQEEQQLMTKLTWEIDSCKQQSAELQKEKKSKEMIEKNERKLEELRSERDCLAKRGGEYAINLTLSNNGVDRNVYHGKRLIGPHVQKLWDQQVRVLNELETKFVAVRY